MLDETGARMDLAVAALDPAAAAELSIALVVGDSRDDGVTASSSSSAAASVNVVVCGCGRSASSVFANTASVAMVAAVRCASKWANAAANSGANERKVANRSLVIEHSTHALSATEPLPLPPVLPVVPASLVVAESRPNCFRAAVDSVVGSATMTVAVRGVS